MQIVKTCGKHVALYNFLCQRLCGAVVLQDACEAASEFMQSQIVSGSDIRHNCRSNGRRFDPVHRRRWWGAKSLTWQFVCGLLAREGDRRLVRHKWSAATELPSIYCLKQSSCHNESLFWKSSRGLSVGLQSSIISNSTFPKISQAWRMQRRMHSIGVHLSNAILGVPSSNAAPRCIGNHYTS